MLVCLRFRSALRDEGRVHNVRRVEVEESKHSSRPRDRRSSRPGIRTIIGRSVKAFDYRREHMKGNDSKSKS